MSNASQVIVVGEDERHIRFVRAYLRRLGYSGRTIRNISLPSGRGCGEQWVRQQYPLQVAALRRRAAKTALVVVIDADTGETSKRSRQLAEALQTADLAQRDKEEAISHLIPKRSIETWILCLSDRIVDEHSDYRPQQVDSFIEHAAIKFHEWTRPNATPPAQCVPSLLAAIPEAKRVEQAR